MTISLTEEDRDWVGNFLAAQWVVAGGDGPLAAALTAPNAVALGPYRTTLEALLAARPSNAGMPLEVCLIHDGWKLLPIKVYRPLAYYAAFGNADIFGCLRAAVVSLLTYGGWMHDIAVLTRTTDVGQVRASLADLNLGYRLHVVTVPGDDILDWNLARYRIDADAVFATHQPIVYLDVDVMCDGTLDAFCLRLAHARGIEVLPEGSLDEGEPDSSGNWFGWRLMAADGLPYDPAEPGFSAGIQGFATRSAVAQAYGAILRSAYGHAEHVGTRHRYAGYDQPVANYVLKKLGLVSHDLLPAVAHFCRVDDSTAEYSPVPDRAIGLVHFTGKAGPGTSKQQIMEHYLAVLKEQGR